MFRSIVMAACLAGLSAGAVLTLVQQPTVAPIILAAEAYESAAVPASAQSAARTPTTAIAAHQHADARAHATDDAAHAHDSDAWAPPVLDGPDGTRVFDDGWDETEDA